MEAAIQPSRARDNLCWPTRTRTIAAKRSNRIINMFPLIMHIPDLLDLSQY